MQTEIQSIYVFDPTELATTIEVVAARYLIPLISPNTIHKDKAALRIRTDRGIKIINAYIDKMLIDNSAWTRCKSKSIVDMWEEFICPEYKHTLEVYELIETLLMDMRIDIGAFIGKDKWIIHFRNSMNGDIIIEKSIDFRIHAWTQEHGWEFKTTERPLRL